MSEYKENVDVLTEEENEVLEEVKVSEDQTKEDPSILDDDIETAVLLVLKKNGLVLPVSDLDNLKMERKATAHDVLRMCADVKDQVSSIRVVGELAQIFQHLNQESLKAVAKLLSLKMEDNINK